MINTKKFFNNKGESIEITEVIIIADENYNFLRALLVHKEGDRFWGNDKFYIASFDNISNYNENQMDDILLDQGNFKEIEYNSIECVDERKQIYSNLVKVCYVDISETEYKENGVYKACESGTNDQIFGLGYTIKDFYADHADCFLETVEDNLYKYVYSENDYNDDSKSIRYVFVYLEEYTNDFDGFIEGDLNALKLLKQCN